MTGANRPMTRDAANAVSDVHHQPRPPVARRVANRREQIFLALQTGALERLTLRLVAQEVEDRISRHAADQFAPLVGYGSRHEIVALERRGGVAGIVGDREHRRVRVHHAHNRRLWRRDDEPCDGHRSPQHVARVDDEDPIRVPWQCTARPKLADRIAHGRPVPDRHRLAGHERANRALVEADALVQPSPFARVEPAGYLRQHVGRQSSATRSDRRRRALPVTRPARHDRAR